MGRPAVIRLTPGNVSDIRVADELIEAAGPVRRLIADRGYDPRQVTDFALSNWTDVYTQARVAELRGRPRRLAVAE